MVWISFLILLHYSKPFLCQECDDILSLLAFLWSSLHDFLRRVHIIIVDPITVRTQIIVSRLRDISSGNLGGILGCFIDYIEGWHILPMVLI